MIQGKQKMSGKSPSPALFSLIFIFSGVERGGELIMEHPLIYFLSLLQNEAPSRPKFPRKQFLAWGNVRLQ